MIFGMFHPPGVVLRGFQRGTRSIMEEVYPVMNMCAKFLVPNAILRLKTYFGGCPPPGGSEGLPAWHPIDNGSIPRHELVSEISGS